MQVTQMKRDINFKDVNNNLIVIRDNYTPELKGCRTIKNALGSNNPNNLVQATVEALARIKG